jgi:hypothetical protein
MREIVLEHVGNLHAVELVMQVASCNVIRDYQPISSKFS